ncbi:MAG: CRISPR-associated protein [Ignavibacteria bacterium]|nr:MAG: CRISPR-associated protein [Ignavibacteria bacterium]KAF0158654.1 MAG: CRISPR-associated protein [Ignavibacteria bacterium]
MSKILSHTETKRRAITMKNNLYLFSDSLIRRKDSSLLCEKLIKKTTEEDELEVQEEKDLKQEEFYLDPDSIIPNGDKKYIPVESVDGIYTFGSIHFTSRLIYFLSQNHIPLHTFNFNGSYAGTFFPSERKVSGSTLIQQAAHYTNYKRRMIVAKEFTTAAVKNCMANLKYHMNRGAHVEEEFSFIEEMLEYVPTAEDVQELFGIEGSIKKTYYSAWKKIFRYPVDFSHRVKNPPNNLINALISYGNAIVYSVCLNQIYQTRLYPEIGFIHEVGEGKLPLCYDLADIFKPIFTDRTIFKVINKNMVSEKDCIRKNGKCFLKESAKKIFVTELEAKLQTTITIDENRKMSYKRLVKEECYKLIKHLNGEEQIKPYISKW